MEWILMIVCMAVGVFVGTLATQFVVFKTMCSDSFMGFWIEFGDRFAKKFTEHMIEENEIGV